MKQRGGKKSEAEKRLLLHLRTAADAVAHAEQAYNNAQRQLVMLREVYTETFQREPPEDLFAS